MKTTDKIRLGIFTVLFSVLLANLFMISKLSESLETMEKSLNTQTRNSAQRMQPQYLIAPPRADGKNPYYEGFFRDYGDNEFHPHRQALMLLLSHLGAQGERSTEEISPDKVQIDIKKPR